MDLMTDIFRGLIGVFSMLGICFLLSSNRKAIDWKLVIGGLVLQLILAVAILQVPFIYNAFDWVADRFVDLLNYTEKGSQFIFGSWPDDAFIQATDFSDGSKIAHKVGYVFAFKVLPTVVFSVSYTHLTLPTICSV